MATPKFVQRVARIPEVIDLLSTYPGGLPLTVVARQFGTDVTTMRQDITTYLDLESWGWFEGVFRRPALEFLHSDEDADGSAGAGDTVVRIVPEATAGLGADYLSAGDLSVLYTAGAALLDVEPDNHPLAEALELIGESMLGKPALTPRPGGWNRHLAVLQEAVDARRKVRIVYSRAWERGVTDRVIEPLRLMQTKRGWEVDAGPVGPEGNLRTFIVSNIRTAEMIDENFEPPAALTNLLAKQRRTSAVQMTVTHDARWAARLLAEDHAVRAEDDDSVTMDLELLPPVAERVALIMLATGPSVQVSPGTLLPQALDYVDALLRHHEGSRSVADVDTAEGEQKEDGSG